MAKRPATERPQGGSGWSLSYRDASGEVVTTFPDSWAFLDAGVLVARWDERAADGILPASPPRTLYVGPSALVTLEELSRPQPAVAAETDVERELREAYEERERDTDAWNG